MGCSRSSTHIARGYEVNFSNFAITLHGEKVIGTPTLIQFPSFTPGNRWVLLHETHELRGNMAHWEGANRILRFLAEPVNRMLSLADSTETWTRRNQWGAWNCFWSVVHFLRGLSIGNQVVWQCLRMGHLEELLPIRKRLSGPTQRIHILWATGDSALSRFASINWRNRECFSEPVGDFISPFQLVLRESRKNGNESIAHDAMIAGRSGSSTKEELITGVDNVGTLSWLKFGDARHGPAARIHVGVIARLAIREIRISPFPSNKSQFFDRFPNKNH